MATVASIPEAEYVAEQLQLGMLNGELLAQIINTAEMIAGALRELDRCIPSTLADSHNVLVPVGQARAAIDLTPALLELCQTLQTAPAPAEQFFIEVETLDAESGELSPLNGGGHD